MTNPGTPMLDNLIRAFNEPKPAPHWGLPWIAVRDDLAPAGQATEESFADAFGEAVGQGYEFVELDANRASVKALQCASTLAYSHGLKVILRNPGASVNPIAIMAHPNVVGVVVDIPYCEQHRTVAYYAAARIDARKADTMPMWFVLADPMASIAADQIIEAQLKGIGVSYPDGKDCLLPLK